MRWFEKEKMNGESKEVEPRGMLHQGRMHE